MRPELIFNNTHYKLNPLIAEVIPVDTAKNDKEKAINMIKGGLDQERAIYLSMYLDDTQMRKFKKFWGGDAEEAV
jgi:hypothetical protein